MSDDSLKTRARNLANDFGDECDMGSVDRHLLSGAIVQIAQDYVAERDAAKHEAHRCQDDNERLRVSLAIALELLGNVERWRMFDGTEHSIAIRKFLADMRAGR